MESFNLGNSCNRLSSSWTAFVDSMTRLISLFIAAYAIGKVRGYGHVCRLTAPITELGFDPSTETFTRIGKQKAEHSDARRLLGSGRSAFSLKKRVRESIFSWMIADIDEEAPILLSHRSLNENSETDDILIKVRYCDCFSELGVEPFYCPATVQYCGATPGGLEEVVGCFNATQHQEIASNALFVASACLCAVFAWLLLSEPGKHTRNYLFGLVFPGWNERLASNLQRQYPERALHMMRIHLRHTHQDSSSHQDEEWLLDADAVRRLMLDLDSPWAINKPDGRRPVALKLKTCIYMPDENGRTKIDEDSLDDCAICYQDLLSGERIGVIACGHKLHSHCLKEWCSRRNTCPLCNCNDIAEPQFHNDSRAMAADLRRNLRI